MRQFPDGWRRETLGELGVQAQPGYASGKHAGTGEVLHLRPMNISPDGTIVTDDCKYVTADAGNLRVTAGDVLFNNTNSLRWVGKTAYVLLSEPVGFSNHMTRLRVGGSLDAQYLATYLHFLQQTGYFESIASNHVNQASVATKRLMQVEVVVPPLDEQRRIVAILEDTLTHIDAAESALRHAQVKLTSLEASFLEGIFVATNSPMVPLGDLLDGIEAGKSVGSTSGPARDGEWGIIKVSAMTYGEFRPDENKAIPSILANPQYRICQGDLLVSRANTEALVGASVMVRSSPNMLLLSDKSLRLLPKPGVSTEWLWRVLQAPSTRASMSAIATGTKDSMRNISQAALRALLVPSVEQTSQHDALRDYEGIAHSLIGKREHIDSCLWRASILRRSLLAAAFRGNLTRDYRKDT